MGLCKNKVWEKNKTVLYGYRQLFYKDIAKNVEARFDTLNYELDRPLAKIKKKKVIGLKKDE